MREPRECEEEPPKMRMVPGNLPGAGMVPAPHSGRGKHHHPLDIGYSIGTALASQ